MRCDNPADGHIVRLRSGRAQPAQACTGPGNGSITTLCPHRVLTGADHAAVQLRRQRRVRDVTLAAVPVSGNDPVAA